MTEIQHKLSVAWAKDMGQFLYHMASRHKENNRKT